MTRLVRGRVVGPAVEASVQFCDFCGETVYRTLLVRVGGGPTLRPSLTAGGRPGQLRYATEYRKACPPCADRKRRELHRAMVVEELGKMMEEMVWDGATQEELDEYIEGWGLDRELVKGFGIPEVDGGRFR